jgi:hypothetical protein
MDKNCRWRDLGVRKDTRMESLNENTETWFYIKDTALVYAQCIYDPDHKPHILAT